MAGAMTLKADDQNPLSPKFAGAIFFAIFAVLFMLFTKYTLLSLKDSLSLPLLPSLLIAAITGAFAGGIFGEVLAKKCHWLRPFFIGILLACLSLILGSLGVLTHSYLSNPSFFARFHHWQDYFVVYGVVLLSLTLTIGLWLIPLTGLVAIYFNKHFFPGLLAVDEKRQLENKQSKTDSTKSDE